MLDLRDLIIQRIEECEGLSARIKDCLSDCTLLPSVDSQIQTNRAILKIFGHSKSRQKYREKMQQELLEDIRSAPLGNAKMLEQFYRASVAIFVKYDSQFIFSTQKDELNERKLRKLYHAFIQTHQTLELTHKIKTALQFINEKSIIALIQYVCDWSKKLLFDCLQVAIANQFQRHEEQMKRINTLKSSSLLSRKQKNRSSFPSVSLRNKQSVYSLFHQDLISYYKQLPEELDLDTSFLKHVRRNHSKSNQLESEQTLRRAAEILIESTNKLIRDSIQNFRTQYVTYFQRYLIVRAETGQKQHSKLSPLKRLQQSSRRAQRYNNTKGDLQRIKSQSNGNHSASKQRRDSLLLRPKPNEISFQLSKEIMKKLQKRKQKQRRELLELPEITQGKSLGTREKTSVIRNKPIYNFFQSNNRSLMGNYQKTPQSSQQVAPKFFKLELRQPLSIEKLLKRDGLAYGQEQRQLIFSSNELKSRKDEEDLKKNRKLMLQLLREKSRRQLFIQN